MSDDSDLEEQPTLADEAFYDPVAERARAYARLFSVVAEATDDEMRKEGLQMLSALRRSFKQIPAGELRSIEGGKSA